MHGVHPWVYTASNPPASGGRPTNNVHAQHSTCGIVLGYRVNLGVNQ